MGYACPVCEDPQSDGEHLANHLAFTAMLGDDAHEAWLDDHVPEWASMDPPALADSVTDHADEREFPQVFEDTTDGHGDHDHSHDDHRHDHGHDTGSSAAAGGVSDLPGGVDAQVPDADSVPEDVLSQAQAMTRERRQAADGDGSGERSGERDDTDDSGASGGDSADENGSDSSDQDDSTDDSDATDAGA